MKKIILLIILISMCSKINAYTEYKIGDKVTYNDIDFYVIKDSDNKEDSVTMLKAEPLTVEEVNQYGAGHINRYTSSSQGTAYDNNGYGGMAYYTSETCGYANGNYVSTGCKSDYKSSEVKYVVDAWAEVKVPSGLQEAGLITTDDVSENLGYEWFDNGSIAFWQKTESTPSWIYNDNYKYWTMSPYNDTSSSVWYVDSDGNFNYNDVSFSSFVINSGGVLRPVIKISKFALGDVNDVKADEDYSKEIITNKQEDKKSETKINVKVANTYLKTSVIIILLGFISAGVGILIYYKIISKKK